MNNDDNDFEFIIIDTVQCVILPCRIGNTTMNVVYFNGAPVAVQVYGTYLEGEIKDQYIKDHYNDFLSVYNEYKRLENENKD